MSRAIHMALLLSAWVSTASAQKQKLIDEPVDRPTVWTSFWIPYSEFFNARFVADGPQITLDFRAQLRKTLAPEQFMDQRIDNVAVVKSSIYDEFMAPVVSDSFLFLFNDPGPTEMFYFHDVPASNLVFLDTFASAPHPGWDTSQGAFFVDPSADAASAPNDLRSPSNASGGSLGLGHATDTTEFASTSITLSGLEAGVEYVLDFWWKSAADDSLSFGSQGIVEDGALFVQVLGTEAILASFDVRPGACTNRLNVRAGGFLQAAILGAPGFDVQQVDIASLRLLGSVVPVRGGVQDVGRPASSSGSCACPGARDGVSDLVLRFPNRDIVGLLGAVTDGDVRELTLTGNLLDGTPISGTDCAVLSVPGPQIASSVVAPFAPLEVSGGPRGVRRIAYGLPEAAHVRLSVYAANGRLRLRLVDATQPAGTHEAWWNPAPMPNGVYFLRFEAAGRTEVAKVVIVQ